MVSLLRFSTGSTHPRRRGFIYVFSLFGSLILLLSLSACNELEEDLANAPEDEQIQRYDLGELALALGTSHTQVSSNIKQLWGVDLVCTQHNVALTSNKRKFVMQNCHVPAHDSAMSSNHEPSTSHSTHAHDDKTQAYQLWDETVESLKLRFFEEKLVQIEILLQINDRYEALYKKQAKRLFAALGKPDMMSLERIVWQTEQDRAILREVQQGRVHLLLQNKLLNDQLIETHQQMER
ncbi:MAG TPA: hypothetical protein ENK78_00405 [Thiothrix sp.]|nr:hypothetical protein [Thiothrix sp.]